MPSRRVLALPLVLAALLAGCAVAEAEPDASQSAPPEPSASASASPTPSASAPAPTAAPVVTPPPTSGVPPTAAPGEVLPFTPLAASTTMTSDDVRALLPTADDVPAGWMAQPIDYAAIGSVPQYWPCGLGYWYVTGAPLEAQTAYAEVRWGSSGSVSAPPFPVSLSTQIWATPDAASAFERIRTDHGACATVGVSDPSSAPMAFPTPEGYESAVCGGVQQSPDGVQYSQVIFCWATAGELLVSTSYAQPGPPQLVLTDAEIQTAFAAAFARALG